MPKRSVKMKHTPRAKAPLPRRPSARAPWIFRHASGLQVLESPAFSRYAWLVHGFSTRPGGLSELEPTSKGKVKSETVLNLGFTDWDKPDRVETNRQEFFRGIGAEKMRIVTLQQIHSDIIHPIHSAPRENVLKGDALITNERGVLLTIQTADCIP